LFAYLAVLLPVAAAASSIATVATRIVAGRIEHLFQLIGPISKAARFSR
jgi:hypothetical protein